MGEVGPSEADDVVNCVNEADEHGAAEVVEKEGVRVRKMLNLK